MHARFIRFLMEFTYKKCVIAILSEHTKLLHFHILKLGQPLCVDKTGYPWPGHIHNYIIVKLCYSPLLPRLFSVNFVIFNQYIHHLA